MSNKLNVYRLISKLTFMCIFILMSVIIGEEAYGEDVERKFIWASSDTITTKIVCSNYGENSGLIFFNFYDINGKLKSPYRNLIRAKSVLTVSTQDLIKYNTFFSSSSAKKGGVLEITYEEEDELDVTCEVSIIYPENSFLQGEGEVRTGKSYILIDKELLGENVSHVLPSIEIANLSNKANTFKILNYGKDGKTISQYWLTVVAGGKKSIVIRTKDYQMAHIEPQDEEAKYIAHAKLSGNGYLKSMKEDKGVLPTQGNIFEIPFAKFSYPHNEQEAYLNIYQETDDKTEIELVSRGTKNTKTYDVNGKERLRIKLSDITNLSEDSIQIISPNKISVVFEDKYSTLEYEPLFIEGGDQGEGNVEGGSGASATYTPTYTYTSTNTPTPTQTLTPTHTYTPTYTPTATPVKTSTPKQSPEESTTSEESSMELRVQKFLWNAKENYETRITCVNYKEFDEGYASDAKENNEIVFFTFENTTGRDVGDRRAIKSGGVLTFSSDELKPLKGNEGVLYIDFWSNYEKEPKPVYIRCFASIIEKDEKGQVVSTQDQTPFDVSSETSYLSFNTNVMKNAKKAMLNIANVGKGTSEFLIVTYDSAGKKETKRKITLRKNQKYGYQLLNFTGSKEGRTYHIEPSNKETEYKAYIRAEYTSGAVVFYKPQGAFNYGRMLPAKGTLILSNVYSVPSYLEYVIYSENKIIYNGRMFIPSYFQQVIDLEEHTKGYKDPVIKINNIPAFYAIECGNEEVCHKRFDAAYLIGEVIVDDSMGQKVYRIEDEEGTLGEKFEIPYGNYKGKGYIDIYNSEAIATKVTLKSRATGEEREYKVEGLSLLRVDIKDISSLSQDSIVVESRSGNINVMYEEENNVVTSNIVELPDYDRFYKINRDRSNDRNEALRISCVYGADNDKDGVCDVQEKVLGMSTSKNDTDGDGVTDSEEVFLYYMDPLSKFTNGISDYEAKQGGRIPIFEEQGGNSVVMEILGGELPMAQYNSSSQGGVGRLPEWGQTNKTVYSNSSGGATFGAAGIINAPKLMDDVCRGKGIRVRFELGNGCGDQTKAIVMRVLKKQVAMMNKYALCGNLSCNDVKEVSGGENLLITYIGASGISYSAMGSHVALADWACYSTWTIRHELSHYVFAFADRYPTAGAAEITPCSVMGTGDRDNGCYSDLDKFTIFYQLCHANGGNVEYINSSGGGVCGKQIFHKLKCDDSKNQVVLQCSENPGAISECLTVLNYADDKTCVKDCDQDCGDYGGLDNDNTQYENCDNMCDSDESLYRILEGGEVKSLGKVAGGSGTNGGEDQKQETTLNILEELINLGDIKAKADIKNLSSQMPQSTGDGSGDLPWDDEECREGKCDVLIQQFLNENQMTPTRLLNALENTDNDGQSWTLEDLKTNPKGIRAASDKYENDQLTKFLKNKDGTYTKAGQKFLNDSGLKEEEVYDLLQRSGLSAEELKNLDPEEAKRLYEELKELDEDEEKKEELKEKLEGWENLLLALLKGLISITGRGGGGYGSGGVCEGGAGGNLEEKKTLKTYCCKSDIQKFATRQVGDGENDYKGLCCPEIGLRPTGECEPGQICLNAILGCEPDKVIYVDDEDTLHDRTEDITEYSYSGSYEIINYNYKLRCCAGKVYKVNKGTANEQEVCCSEDRFANEEEKCCNKSQHASSGHCCAGTDKSKVWAENYNGRNICCKIGYHAKVEHKCCSDNQHVSSDHCCEGTDKNVTYRETYNGRNICCDKKLAYSSKEKKCCAEGEAVNERTGKCEKQPCPSGEKYFDDIKMCCTKENYAGEQERCCNKLKPAYVVDYSEHESKGYCCSNGPDNTLIETEFKELWKNNEGIKIPICCMKNQDASNGHCCEKGKKYIEDIHSCCAEYAKEQKECCDPNGKEDSGYCCPEGTVYRDNKEEDGKKTPICCDKNVSYSSQQKRCCTQGEVYEDGECKPRDDKCPKGQRYNDDTKECEDIKCEDGEKLNDNDECVCKDGYERGDDGQCHETTPPVCPVDVDGNLLLPLSLIEGCRPPCPEGKEYDEDGNCVCEEGSSEGDDGECHPVPTITPSDTIPPPTTPTECPDNQHVNNDGVCECNDGYVPDKEGVCKPECPDGSRPQNGDCVPICGDNQHLNDNNECVCDKKYVLNSDGDCELKKCSPGFRLNENGECVPIECDGEGKHRNENNECVCDEGLEEGSDGNCHTPTPPVTPSDTVPPSPVTPSNTDTPSVTPSNTDVTPSPTQTKCPDYQWEIDGECWDKCPEGQTYRGTRENSNEPICCDSGVSYSSSQGRCCDKNETYDDGLCKERNCPKGYRLNRYGKCEPIECPDGEHLNDSDECVCNDGLVRGSDGGCESPTPVVTPSNTSVPTMPPGAPTVPPSGPTVPPSGPTVPPSIPTVPPSDTDTPPVTPSDTDTTPVTPSDTVPPSPVTPSDTDTPPVTPSTTDTTPPTQTECPENQEEVNGECKDKCPQGQERGDDGECHDPDNECDEGKIKVEATGECCPKEKYIYGECCDNISESDVCSKLKNNCKDYDDFIVASIESTNSGSTISLICKRNGKFKAVMSGPLSHYDGVSDYGVLLYTASLNGYILNNFNNNFPGKILRCEESTFIGCGVNYYGEPNTGYRFVPSGCSNDIDKFMFECKQEIRDKYDYCGLLMGSPEFTEVHTCIKSAQVESGNVSISMDDEYKELCNKARNVTGDQNICSNRYQVTLNRTSETGLQNAIMDEFPDFFDIYKERVQIPSHISYYYLFDTDKYGDKIKHTNQDFYYASALNDYTDLKDVNFRYTNKVKKDISCDDLENYIQGRKKPVLVIFYKGGSAFSMLRSSLRDKELLIDNGTVAINNVNFVYINVDDACAEKYDMNINAMPSVILYSGGRKKSSKMGDDEGGSCDAWDDCALANWIETELSKLQK